MALKIVAIDDEPAMSKLISLLLESYGMEVIPANDGHDGIRMVQAEKPDLVLLDLMMPDMSGIEVCQAIRAFSDVPILAYSALTDKQEVDIAFKAGVNAHLEKPTPSDVLVKQIKKLVKV